MRFYCGVDLHSNNSVLGIMDETGKRLKRRRVHNELAAVDAVLRPYREGLAAVVVESTYNWYWLVDGLQDLLYPVRLAHPAGLTPYSGLKHEDDVDSAFWLAELARVNSLSEAYIYPREQRGVRDLLRQRSRLVRGRTAHVLSIKNVIARENGQRLSRAQLEVLDQAGLEQVVRDGWAQAGVRAVLRVIACSNEQIRAIEQQVLEHVKPDPLFGKLQSIWGVGLVLAVTIRLESGPMERFPTVGDYASYCRCVGSARLSNAKPKGENNKRNGNGYLEWAFVEAAHHAAVNYQPAARFLERKRARTHPVLASKALASKLCKAAFYVMRDQVQFDPEKLFR